MSRRYLAIFNGPSSRKSLFYTTTSRLSVRFSKNTISENRSIHTQSKTECEAIAEQCLLEAKLIQQRHRRGLTSNLSSPPIHASPPRLTHFQKSSTLPNFALLPNTKLGQQRQKWKWKWNKCENEEKEETGIWSLLIAAIFFGSAGYGGGSAFWEEISKLKEMSLCSPS